MLWAKALTVSNSGFNVLWRFILFLASSFGVATIVNSAYLCISHTIHVSVLLYVILALVCSVSLHWEFRSIFKWRERDIHEPVGSGIFRVDSFHAVDGYLRAPCKKGS